MGKGKFREHRKGEKMMTGWSAFPSPAQGHQAQKKTHLRYQGASMRSAYSALLACLACRATCHGFTLAVSGAPPPPHTSRAFLPERRTTIVMGKGARGTKQMIPLAKAGAGAARVVSASTASVVEIFSSHLSCADSAAAKRLLGSAGVEFTEHDCSSSEHAECAPMSRTRPANVRSGWRQAGFTSASACLRLPSRPANQSAARGPRWPAKTGLRFDISILSGAH